MRVLPRQRLVFPWQGAAFGLACGLIGWSLAGSPVARGLEDWLQDAHFAAQGARATRSKVIIVSLDDDSLAALPKPLAAASPELAEVVAYLDGQEAAAIGLDVFVPETLDAYDDKPGLGGGLLGLAAARSGKVVLPVTLGDDGRLIRPLRSWQTVDTFGLIEVTEDRDRFVRRQLLAATVGERSFDSFALALLDVAGRAKTVAGAPGRRPGRAGGCRRLRPDQLRRPAGDDPARPVPGRPDGRARGGRRRPSSRARSSSSAPARSLGDWHATPYANGTWRWPWLGPPGLTSGPELQANAVATLADGSYITTPRWLSPLPLCVLTGLVSGVAFARLSLSRGALVAFGFHFGWKGLVLAAFVLASWRVEMVAVLATNGLCYAGTFGLRWRLLRRMFGAVKSEAVVRALENDPGHLHRAGDKRVVTVMFSDIRGFTAFSEGRTPREIVALLNAYFGAVVPIVEARGGVIDKYIGDGLMVLFGASAMPPTTLAPVEAAVETVRQVHERARPGPPSASRGCGSGSASTRARRSSAPWAARNGSTSRRTATPSTPRRGSSPRTSRWGPRSSSAQPPTRSCRNSSTRVSAAPRGPSPAPWSGRKTYSICSGSM